MLRRLLYLCLITTLTGCASSVTAQTDSRIFVFAAQRAFVIDPNKGEANQILNETNGDHYSVSQDGRWIAYSMISDDRTGIWTKNLNDSSNARKVVDLPFNSEQIVGRLAWSRDSNRLAFLATFTDEPFREQLGVIEVESEKLEFITGPVFRFAWSPVDDRIAVYPSGVDSAIGLYLIDPAAENWFRLCKANSCQVEDLAWSPNGQQIVFIDNRDNQLGQVIILDVVKKTRVLAMPQSSGFLKEVTWSPNGQYITFCDSTGSVFVMNVLNKDEQKVGEHAYRCSVWSPDSKFIAYIRDDTSNLNNESGRLNLVKVSVPDGITTILTEITPGIDYMEWR